MRLMRTHANSFRLSSVIPARAPPPPPHPHTQTISGTAFSRHLMRAFHLSTENCVKVAIKRAGCNARVNKPDSTAAVGDV
jgi:hypothetical protein